MAKNQEVIDYYSTYTKIYINDWIEFRKCLAEHTAAISGSSPEIQDLPLIIDKDLNDALNGPYAPVFKDHLDAYLSIKQLGFEKRDAYESVFTDAKKKLPENPCNMQDRAADQKIERKKVPNELLEIITSAELEKKQDELNALFEQSFSTFTKLHKAAYNEATKIFSSIGCNLSEQDKSFLYADEPLNEVQRRFIDISLEIPKIKDRGLFFSHYFQLKLILGIHSSLSLQQQPHGDKEIKDKLKEFKNIINTCEMHEEKMMDTQKSNISGITKSIDY